MTAWGHTGSELGRVQVRLLAELHPAPRRRHRGGGRIRVRRRLRQQSHRALQPRRRRTDRSGAPRAAGPGSSPIRAASPPTRPRCSSPTTTTTASRSSAPSGEYQGSVGSYGTGPGQFGFPYGVALDAAGDVYVADDINHRIVKLNPALGFVGRMGRLRLGARAARVPARARQRSRPATPTSPTPPTIASRCSTRAAPTCARSASPRTPPACSSRRAGSRSIPTGRLLVSDTRRQPHRVLRPGRRRAAGRVVERRRVQARLRRTRRASRIDPRRLGVRRRHRQRAAGAAVGRRHLPVRTRRSRRPRRRRAERSRLGRGVRGGRGVRRRHRPQPRPRSTPPRACCWSASARAAATASRGSSGRARSTTPRPSPCRAVGRRVRRRHRQQPHRRAVPRRHLRQPVRRAGLRRRAPAHPDRRRASTPPGGCMSWTTSTTASRCSTNPATTSPSGACAASAWATSPSRRPSPSAAKAACSWPTRTTTASSASTPPHPRASAACLRGAWPPPLDVAPVLRVSVPRRGGILARGGLALTVSCERGCKILVTATLSPAPLAPRRGAARRRPPAAARR